MAKLTLQQLGPMIREQRGVRPIRQVAAEIGVSAATLSRVERGNLPDLNTFPKICRWLGLDAGEVLGLETAEAHEDQSSVATVHFRANRNIRPELAQSLAELIIRAQQIAPDES